MTDDAPKIQVGSKVPDFKLATYEPSKEDFGEFSLAENMSAGKWTILFFYPADFTFVWATEFAALAEQNARFEKLGARIVTVSTDTQFVHLAWKQNEGELKDVAYTMASDANGEVSRMFGVYLDDAGVALRGTFIISPDGTLMGQEVLFLNYGRNIDELMRRFKALLHVTKKPKEACPSKWQDEGDKTLEPGPHMVGKVHEALK